VTLSRGACISSGASVCRWSSETPARRADYEQLAREILKEAAGVDAAEDELFGDAGGDELPPEFQSTGELRKRLREAKQRLDAKRAAEI
jgi:hypothetical protein